MLQKHYCTKKLLIKCCGNWHQVKLSGKVEQSFVGETECFKIMTASREQCLLLHLRIAPKGC